jgi:hypothetical protein
MTDAEQDWGDIAFYFPTFLGKTQYFPQYLDNQP